MNKISLLSFLFMLSSCYAMGGKRPTWSSEQERSFENKIFWPCTAKQVLQPEGLWCNQICVKKSESKCLEVKQNIIDVKKDHDILLKSGFLIAPSKLLFN